MSVRVQIKGIREGLLVSLGDGDWNEVHQALMEQVEKQIEFLRGGRLVIDVGNQILHAVELGKLRDELSERGLSLWGVLGSSPTTEQTAQTLGLATRLSRPSRSTVDRHSAPAATTLYSGEEAILVRRTLRSGFSIQHPGHVVIIGDVNPGAEVIAGGDVVVWGRLRGVVHAGAEGNEGAVICALDLSPTQLRISGQISIPPQRRGKPQPEMVRLQDGQVVAEPWNTGR